MNFLKRALDFIFPPTCGICGKNAKSYLCTNCKQNLINSQIFLNQSNSYQNKYINEHFYIFSYEGIIREKILQYKFKEYSYLSNTFCEFFINNKKLYGFLKKYDIITSVPISNLRKRERGYNQSEIIAKELARLAEIKMEKHVLLKTKDNKMQSTLNKEERKNNVKNVYKLINKEKIDNKKILIFDDIYTTGATIEACIEEISKANIKQIGIITLAKD